MAEIVAHVVAAEWQHRERVAAKHALGTLPARPWFQSPSSPPCRHLQPSCAPRLPTAPSSSGGRRTRKRRSARRSDLPSRRRSTGHWAAATVNRAFGCAALRPALPSSGVQSLPCQSIRCAGRRPHALPPDIAIVGQRDVGEDHVLVQHRHRIVIRFLRRTRRDAEASCFGIDRVQPSVRALA